MGREISKKTSRFRRALYRNDLRQRTNLPHEDGDHPGRSGGAAYAPRSPLNSSNRKPATRDLLLRYGSPRFQPETSIEELHLCRALNAPVVFSEISGDRSRAKRKPRLRGNPMNERDRNAADDWMRDHLPDPDRYSVEENE